LHFFWPHLVPSVFSLFPPCRPDRCPFPSSVNFTAFQQYKRSGLLAGWWPSSFFSCPWTSGFSFFHRIFFPHYGHKPFDVEFDSFSSSPVSHVAWLLPVFFSSRFFKSHNHLFCSFFLVTGAFCFSFPCVRVFFFFPLHLYPFVRETISRTTFFFSPLSPVLMVMVPCLDF